MAADGRMDRRPSGTPPQGPKNDDDERRRQAYRRLWSVVIYVVIGLVALYLFQQFVLGPMSGPSSQLSYAEFKTKVAGQQIKSAVISESRITGTIMYAGPKDP